MLKKFLNLFIATALLVSLISPAQAQKTGTPVASATGADRIFNSTAAPVFSGLVLPPPGQMVLPTAAFEPVLMKGLKVDPARPLRFDFVLSPGEEHPDQAALKSESAKLIKYFLAALTIPEQDLWVNLSPYEQNRMIMANLGQTELGRDLLAQDYMLKQLTASLIYPETEAGRAFWDRAGRARISAFNKVWIVADRADVYEQGNAAYVVGAHLKVMMEEDYLAMTKQDKPGTAPSQSDPAASAALKDIVLPMIEREVNTGKHFAALRQMFYAMILATWYKTALKEALVTKIYGDQSKVKVGVNQPDPGVNLKIFERYLQAYKKGVFNYIKEEPLRPGAEVRPRKYFSGGLQVAPGPALLRRLKSAPSGSMDDQAVIASVDLAMQTKPAANDNLLEEALVEALPQLIAQIDAGIIPAYTARKTGETEGRMYLTLTLAGRDEHLVPAVVEVFQKIPYCSVQIAFIHDNYLMTVKAKRSFQDLFLFREALQHQYQISKGNSKDAVLKYPKEVEDLRQKLWSGLPSVSEPVQFPVETVLKEAKASDVVEFTLHSAQPPRQAKITYVDLLSQKITMSVNIWAGQSRPFTYKFSEINSLKFVLAPDQMKVTKTKVFFGNGLVLDKADVSSGLSNLIKDFTTVVKGENATTALVFNRPMPSFRTLVRNLEFMAQKKSFVWKVTGLKEEWTAVNIMTASPRLLQNVKLWLESLSKQVDAAMLDDLKPGTRIEFTAVTPKYKNSEGGEVLIRRGTIVEKDERYVLINTETPGGPVELSYSRRSNLYSPRINEDSIRVLSAKGQVKVRSGTVTTDNGNELSRELVLEQLQVVTNHIFNRQWHYPAHTSALLYALKALADNNSEPVGFNFIIQSQADGSFALDLRPHSPETPHKAWRWLRGLKEKIRDSVALLPSEELKVEGDQIVFADSQWFDDRHETAKQLQDLIETLRPELRGERQNAVVQIMGKKEDMTLWKTLQGAAQRHGDALVFQVSELSGRPVVWAGSEHFNERFRILDWLTALKNIADQAQAAPVNGGIDLNAAHLRLNRRGVSAGRSSVWDAAMIAEIRRQGFQGFQFHIRNLMSVNNLPSWLQRR